MTPIMTLVVVTNVAAVFQLMAFAVVAVSVVIRGLVTGFVIIISPPLAMSPQSARTKPATSVAHANKLASLG